MSDANPCVVLETAKGDITIELDAQAAPITTQNFLDYVNDGFYNDTIFHRVIPNFMVQGGGMTAEMDSKPTKAPITNEASNGLGNNRGTIAMARTADPDSATAQFFINVADNHFLNHQPNENPGYAVFGKVIDGMDIADAIVAVPTGQHGPHSDVPQEPITINKAYVKA
ncbi:MAG: peptidylprolyl isomerase [Sedimentisphaerales bacterium]|nr:peptidylprolyl isomerase [Sedimentisphaerales bacterium]